MSIYKIEEMKRIVTYNALGEKRLKKDLVIELLKHIIYCIYAPLCQLLIGIAAKRQRPKRFKVAICAIFKNEAENLQEWISYHKLIGVEHFYLYNNFSDDDYLRVLEPFIAKDEVTLIGWQYKYGQMSAYTNCLERFSSDANWIAFIDLDEFICLREEISLGNWLRKFRRYPSVMLNWKFFGTSSLLERDPSKLTIEQFDSSWACFTDVGKSIVNTSFVFDECYHVHRFRARLWGLPLYAVDEFGSFVIFWIYRRHNDCRESKAQLNHYWSRSYAEFIYKENMRGDALSEKNEKIRKGLMQQRFTYHESQNTVKDHTIQRHLLALKLIMERV
ncbi:MAG: glycosyltransferase family 92 protein [Rikenellaceae bacterium]